MIGYNGIVNLRNDGVDPSTTKKDLNAAIGALITVRFATVPPGQGVAASLFDIDDLAIANPATSDNFGNYFFKIATGTYDIIFQEGTANEVIEPAQAIGQTAELINDLSQAYTFDTVALMESSVIVFPTGKKITTKGYYAIGDGGGAEYIVTAGASPNIGSPALTVGLHANITNKNGVNIKQWGAFNDGATLKTDNTAVFLACKAECIANDLTLVADDGNFWFPADIDLWGIRKIDLRCSIRFDNATDKIIVGGNTVAAPTSDIYILETQGTIQVYGMNRGNLKFVAANTLYLFADQTVNRHTVSYSKFEWVNLDHLHLECQDPAGSSGAWINENKFYAGRVRVSFLMDGTYPMNNNIFYGMAMESLLIDIEIGQNNQFHDVRLEGVNTFNFGASTFNNLFWQTWGNFANTALWDLPVSTYNITDLGDNNRIVPVHYAYTEKDALLLIDREHLGDGTVFKISATNPDKVEILQNAAIICDTGLVPVTDKLWFTLAGSTNSFFIQMEVYDEDGAAITIEPATGFKTSQGVTVWDAAGFWKYASPVSGGNYAVNPIKDTSVKYVRFVGITENGATGDEHTRIIGKLVQTQENKMPVKNLVADSVRIDAISNSVSATSEATAIDLFKFTSKAITATDAVGSLAGRLDISLTGQKGSAEDAASATVDIMVTQEDTGVMTITAGTPSLLSNGGAFLIDGIIIGTKAGATVSEVIMTITITSSTHSDPFDSLNARARLTGIADYNPFRSYLIAAEKI